MCGFVGYVNQSEDTAENQKIIRAMADKIVHRGPDQDDYYVDGAVSLGFRRLSIIDLEGGSQPISNEDGTKVLVFNGEIYNYQPLRAELLAAGHRFKTETDSEVLLHGFEEWGKALLPRLRGMFAFVIWDTQKKALFGARDIFGIKPFFYYKNGSDFLFGSEIKSFLAHPKFKKELNEKRLPEYLCFEYLPDTETMFKNVYKMEPGAWFVWQDGNFTTERYYTPEYKIDRTPTLSDWETKIDETFRASTKAHGIADVEVGCFLSGGVDSSYVVHEVAKRHAVKTFSVGYAEKKYSELAAAEEFAATQGVQNFSDKITAEAYFDAVPTVQYYMDEPLPNPSAIALYFLTKLAAKQVKVVLSGEGADELFGGYHYYREPLDFERYMRLPQGLRSALSAVASHLPNFHGKRFLMRGSHPIAERYIRNNYVFSHDEVDKVLAKPAHAPDPSVFTKPFFDEVESLDDITKMQYVDIRTWLVQDILVKADRMSMANSLELRVPFLDKEMLAVALQIPPEYRVDTETTKVALRGAAAKRLPQKTAKMRKTGFLTPLNDWLKRDEFYTQVKTVFTSDIAKQFFNTAYILKLLEDHKAGTAHNMKKVWSIYCFLVWYDEYFVKR